MDNYISGSNELLIEARIARDKLALEGGHEQLLRKIDDLLFKSTGVGLHGGEVLKLRNLLSQVEALK